MYKRQGKFDTFKTELADYNVAIYETEVDADTRDAERDFDDVAKYLDDLTRNTWVIRVRYETEGNAPSSGGGSVSYTHLDVYKRQPICNWTARPLVHCRIIPA